MAARRRALLMIFSASPSSGASVSSGIRVSLMTSGPIEDDEHIATVADDEAGTRLDAFLAARFPIFSRNRIKDLILAGAVEVDGATNVTPKYRVKPAESIVLVAPQPIDAEPEGQDIALDILFEDDHLIVINKPAGLVVHPAPGNADGTLVNALIHHCGDSLRGIGGVKRPGIVHRLDKDTTGLMVVAKTLQAHTELVEQLADRTVSREYEAIAVGAMTGGGTVDAPIGRHPKQRKLMAVLSHGGKRAVTHVTKLRDLHGAALVRCRLETGRTHQIRVHLADHGFPLLGDPVYGRKSVDERVRAAGAALARQALHARVLGFLHPITSERLRFEVEPPADFQRALSALAE
jgi:23S rRNA pseudouridine1911/1915/1917 synthase